MKKRRAATVLATTTLSMAALALISVAPARAMQDAASTAVVNIRFPGGSAVEYVGAIHDQARDANIVIMPGAEAIRMPAMELQNVSISTALALLDGQQAIQTNQSFELSVDREVGAAHGGGSDVYLINVHHATHGRMAPRTSHVMSVAQILHAGVEAADLLAAIDAAIDLVVEGDGPEVRFHESTGLLIAHGSPDHIELIRGVVEEVFSSALVPRKEQERGAKLEALQERNNQLSTVVEALESEVAARNQMIIELETRYALLEQQSQESLGFERRLVEFETRNQLLQQHVDALQMEVLKRDDELRHMQSEYHAVRNELDKRGGN